MYQQDWILRQIESMVKMVARFVFKKDIIKYEIIDESKYSKTDLLYKRILELLGALKINEAENMVFDIIDGKNLNHLKIALDFYSRLNELSDEELEKCNFNREEIKDGLEDVMKIYNINTLNF